MALASADIVSIWERGRGRPDWSKALVMLGPILPDSRPSEISALTVGERNARLLALRRELIGPVIHALVDCPACAEPLEFEQDIAELLDGYAPPAGREFSFSSGDCTVRYRPITSDDLAAAAGRGDEAEARLLLLDHAVLEASRGGAPAMAADLPQDFVEPLAADMAERDPLAYLPIPLVCAGCDHVWTATFQIVPFLWIELERKAKALLDEIVALARGYGWTEREILALSPGRRQFYLDALG